MVALKVRSREGHLRKLFQDAEKLHRDGHQDAYERDAVEIYGFLREAWERALEEVLLGGVVERFRSTVQTRQVALLEVAPRARRGACRAGSCARPSGAQDRYRQACRFPRSYPEASRRVTEVGNGPHRNSRVRLLD